MTGYSDRINHALAFAAKHHDRLVRQGAGLPYATRPANVAIILTRYGQDDDVVIAGILHGFVEDCVRDGWTREMLEDRIVEKFGTRVLEAALEASERKVADDGSELHREERKTDLLRRLSSAGDAARWVRTAGELHLGSVILADLRRTVDIDVVWARFAAGRDGTLKWYRAVLDALRAPPFSAPIIAELQAVVEALETHDTNSPRR